MVMKRVMLADYPTVYDYDLLIREAKAGGMPN